MTVFHQVAAVERTVMTDYRRQTPLACNQKRKVSVGIAVVRAEYRRNRFGFEDLKPSVTHREPFAQQERNRVKGTEFLENGKVPVFNQARLQIMPPL